MYRREEKQEYYQNNIRRGRRRRKYKQRKRRKRFLKWVFRIGIVLGVVCLVVYLGTVIDWSFGALEKADVVLDAGHGGKDGGAVKRDVLEKDINLEITNLVKQQLEESGLCVKMVREDDSFLSLKERVKYANKYKAKAYVSIHCNSAEGEASGIETYYDRFDVESQMLADYIQQSLIAETSAKDRGVKTADYTVVREAKMPAALTEVGFLSNDEEGKLLQDLEYQKKLAKGIADGVEAFLEERVQP